SAEEHSVHCDQDLPDPGCQGAVRAGQLPGPPAAGEDLRDARPRLHGGCRSDARVRKHHAGGGRRGRPGGGGRGAVRGAEAALAAQRHQGLRADRRCAAPRAGADRGRVPRRGPGWPGPPQDLAGHGGPRHHLLLRGLRTRPRELPIRAGLPLQRGRGDGRPGGGTELRGHAGGRDHQRLRRGAGAFKAAAPGGRGGAAGADRRPARGPGDHHRGGGGRRVSEPPGPGRDQRADGYGWPHAERHQTVLGQHEGAEVSESRQ
ncbi:unnamed protein product, partial [Effrenium voratum]